MNTPVPFICLALNGKIDFVKVTSPFGDGGKDEGNKPDPSPKEVEAKVRGLMAMAGKR